MEKEIVGSSPTGGTTSWLFYKHKNDCCELFCEFTVKTD